MDIKEVMQELRARMLVPHAVTHDEVISAAAGSFLLARVQLRIALRRLGRSIKACMGRSCPPIMPAETPANTTKQLLHLQAIYLAKTTPYSLTFVQSVQRDIKRGLPEFGIGELTDEQVLVLTPDSLSRWASLGL